MTAQIGERLIYKGKNKVMCSEPLYSYLQTRKDFEFSMHSTACWRGYYGEWEIIDNKLFLIDLSGYIYKIGNVDLNYVFPGQDVVFADWFTGNIRIPQGELLEYRHMGYLSTFEEDLILEFREGILIGEKVIDNREEFKKKQSENEKDQNTE